MGNKQKASFVCTMIVVTMNICFEFLFIAPVYNSLPLLCEERRPVLHSNFFLLCSIE